MLVSVVITIYNTAQYLEKCLDSIVGQTYRELQIILVDDGSTDDSPQICKRYAEGDERILYHRKENGGLVRARRTGIDLAQGEFIFFCDSDDYIDSDCIEIMVADQLRTGADIVATPLIRETPTYSTVLPQPVGLLASGRDYLEILLRHETFSAISSRMYRRDILRDMKVYSDFWMWEDFIFNLQVSTRNPKVYFTEKPMYHYLYWPGSLSRSRRVEFGYITDFMEAVREILAEGGVDTDRHGVSIVADKVHWISTYIKKSSNPWMGNTIVANDIIGDVKKYYGQLIPVTGRTPLRRIILYNRRINLPLIRIMSMLERLSNSYRRRKTK